MPDVTDRAPDDTIAVDASESRRTLLKRGAAAAAAAAVAGIVGAKRAEAAPTTHLAYLSAKYQNFEYALSGLYMGGSFRVDAGTATTVPGTSIPASIVGTASGAGTGLAGTASAAGGIGVAAGSDAGAPLYLIETAIGTIPPTTGDWTAGMFVVKSGELWYCYTSGTGSASKWVKLSAALKTLAQPVRAYDSRISSGGPGPILAGQTRTIDLTTAGVPDNSTAALLSFQLISTIASGFLSVYSAGIATLTPPTFSTMQWSGSGQRLANEITSAVSTTGGIKVYGGGKTDFFVDVIGYYP